MTTPEILTRLKSIQRWKSCQGGYNPDETGAFVKWEDLESLIEEIENELN